MTTNKVTAYKPASNGKNYSGDKEMVSAYSVIVSNGDGMKELVTARVWMARSNSASVAYASVWVLAGEKYTAGHGTAKGYGYHRPSAAIGEAIESAGIKLEKSIYGVGDSAITDALTAIANYLGYQKVLVVNH